MIRHDTKGNVVTLAAAKSVREFRLFPIDELKEEWHAIGREIRGTTFSKEKLRRIRRRLEQVIKEKQTEVDSRYDIFVKRILFPKEAK